MSATLYFKAGSISKKAMFPPSLISFF